MTDPDRLARRIERQTGAVVTLRPYEGERHSWTYVEMVDPEMKDRKYVRLAHTATQAEAFLREMREEVYRARCREVHRRQGGKCAQCGRKLGVFGEGDHILSRGAHGRDDRIANIQTVCPPFLPGGCNYHREKHGQARRTA